ncbi:DUF5682 family protein [Methylobacterium oryzisoli]|uniref:DUF5682 family protein n=1 Tax=Methylobacterium oryzisoli TaxID=3385502 RepID=UPI003891B173
MPDIRLFGIRHHGPGSARSLRAALDALDPDCLLIEGPPDADALIPLSLREGMAPPVALLVYRPDRPRDCAFFPFADFSPEWVAMRHGIAAGASVRFIDLPHANQLADGFGVPEESPEAAPIDAEPLAEATDTPPEDGPAPAPAAIRRDPLGELAAAAGYPDGERWWDALVESRAGADGDVFAAIGEAMTALREGAELDADEAFREEAREAHMRAAIRKAAKEGFARIAVVCGAWHVPALARHDAKGQATADAATLKNLPKTKVAAAWAPWSYERLAFASGYRAGVLSPEWYDSRVAELSGLIGTLLDADLAGAGAEVIRAINDRAALSADVFDLMEALPPLAELARYGSVRSSDTAPVLAVVRGLVPRVAAGLVAACQSLDDDAAAAAKGRLVAVSGAVALIEEPELKAVWQEGLRGLADQEHAHGRVVGRAVRLLFDDRAVAAEEAGDRMRLSLSRAAAPPAAAAWIEGFLEDSGTALIHGQGLLPVVDEWLCGLDEDTFTELLPLVRRTFATIAPAERRVIGEALTRPGGGAPGDTAPGRVFDAERAARVLPILRLLLGPAPAAQDTPFTQDIPATLEDGR